MVDKLVEVVDGTTPMDSYAELVAFYEGYLRDVYAWRVMVRRAMARRV